MILLSEAFPKYEFSVPLYKKMLMDLGDECFMKAIVEIIRNTTELYPNTNLIAVIRQKALYEQKVLMERRPIAYLKEERFAAPPPPGS